MYYNEITMTLDERAAFLQDNQARFTHDQHRRKMILLTRDRALVPLHRRMAKEFVARCGANP